MTASAQEKFKSIKLRRKPGSDGVEEWDLITPLEDDESENALEHLNALSHPNGPTTRVQAHEITVQVRTQINSNQMLCDRHIVCFLFLPVTGRTAWKPRHQRWKLAVTCVGSAGRKMKALVSSVRKL